MRAYTDIEQSKTLAKILPIESADMTYLAMTKGVRGEITIYDWEISIGLNHAITQNLFSYRNGYVVPAWSLAALLSVYPMVVGRDMDMYCCWQNSKNLHSRHYDNPIDACVEMIIKLKEKGLI